MRNLNLALLAGAAVSSTVIAQTPPVRPAARQTTQRPAQPANDTVAYVYLLRTDTVAIERVVTRADGVRAELIARNQPRFVWNQRIDANNMPGSFDLDAYAPTAGPGAVPAQSVTLRMMNDSGFMDINANGATNTVQRMKFTAGSAWMLNSSVLHTDVLASLALKRKQDTINVVLAQGGTQLRMGIRKVGDTVFVNMAGQDAKFVRDARGLKEATMGGTTSVRRVNAADMAKLGVKTAAEKPSYAAPAGAPYTAEDVVINTESGFQLAGTLTKPRGIAKPPIVITISGSGEQDRDSRLGPVAGYAIFRDIADSLGRRGIAVLRVDDRGVGASTGRESRAVATSADYATDVREVVKFVRARNDVDGARIALVGHSEGGMIAPMVASQDKAIRAVALMAGPAYTGRRVMLFQNQDAVNQAKGLTSTQRDSIMATVPARLDSIAKSEPWIGFFMQHDPLKVAKLVTQPVLILQGETDHQVTPEQADTLSAALKSAGNTDVTVRKFGATNHLFLADTLGVASGYASLPDKHVRRTVLGALADWLAVKLK